MKIRYLSFITLFTIASILLLKSWTPSPVIQAETQVTSSMSTQVSSASSWVDKQVKAILPQASNLNPSVFKLSLAAYLKARKEGMDDKQVLTIVDYSKPSNERRLWVLDLKNEKVLFNTFVAHGKNSGDVNATSFSNQPNSLKTSLGVFATGDTYEGHNGLSLHMQGLESGFNDNAYKREIVFHGAWYAGQDVAQARGMLGRSWGCPAVDQHIAKPLINTIKEDTVVVAYYPDKNWLQKSTFVNYHAA